MVMQLSKKATWTKNQCSKHNRAAQQQAQPGHAAVHHGKCRTRTGSAPEPDELRGSAHEPTQCLRPMSDQSSWGLFPNMSPPGDAHEPTRCLSCLAPLRSVLQDVFCASARIWPPSQNIKLIQCHLRANQRQSTTPIVVGAVSCVFWTALRYMGRPNTRGRATWTSDWSNTSTSLREAGTQRT